MTTREEILGVWNDLKTKFFQLKTKSIDNYEIITKRAILDLNNWRSDSPLKLCSFIVAEGEVRDPLANSREVFKSNRYSNDVVEIYTELLKVAILERIDEEDPFIKNYEGELYLD